MGGIIGNFVNTGNEVVNKCYNVGNISVYAPNATILKVGGVVGIIDGVPAQTQIQNCYYLKGTAEHGIGDSETPYELQTTEMTSAEMKSSDFVDLLNKDNENMWKEDTNNINNGYPILYWQ